jgi:sortase A
MKNKIGKRIKKETRVKSIIKRVIILFIFIIAIGIFYGRYKENKIKLIQENEQINIEKTESVQNLFSESNEENNYNENKSNQENNEIQNDINNEIEIFEQNGKIKEVEEMEKVSETYEGYLVTARIEIPNLYINSNVLANYSKEGLEKCVSKYWGPEPNEIGNFCIAGHNYGRKNMFGYLGDLKIGDKIYLSDNKNGKYVYTIYTMYRVEPENVEVLSQNTNGKREITLITCSNYSKSRLIVKAIEGEATNE